VRRYFRFGVLGALIVGILSACVVRTERVVATPGPCPGAVWVQAHYDRRGWYHPAQWHCPGSPYY